VKKTLVLAVLEICMRELCSLCATWQSEVCAIPVEGCSSISWGPSEAQLRNANVLQPLEVYERGENEEILNNIKGNSDDEGSSDEEWGSDEDDGELLDAMETLAFTDMHYRGRDLELIVEDDVVF